MPTGQRRYTKRTKLAATMAAEISGVTVAAEELGIPHQTISYWMNDPRLGEIRRKTREDLAEEIKTVAHLAWKHVAKALQDGTIEPRDALFAAEKATGLSLLMSGEPTERTETRDLTDVFDDHETRAIVDAAREYVGRAGSREGELLAVEETVAATGEEGPATT